MLLDVTESVDNVVDDARRGVVGAGNTRLLAFFEAPAEQRCSRIRLLNEKNVTYYVFLQLLHTRTPPGGRTGRMCVQKKFLTKIFCGLN